MLVLCTVQHEPLRILAAFIALEEYKYIAQNNRITLHGIATGDGDRRESLTPVPYYIIVD